MIKAGHTHANATSLRKDYEASAKKDPQAKAEYIEMYAKAAELYRSFIDQYSDSDYVYEFNFLMGEALLTLGLADGTRAWPDYPASKRPLHTVHRLGAGRTEA